MHGVRGASGDVRVLVPGFPPDLRPPRAPLAPLVHSFGRARDLGFLSILFSKT